METTQSRMLRLQWMMLLSASTFLSLAPDAAARRVESAVLWFPLMCFGGNSS